MRCWRWRVPAQADFVQTFNSGFQNGGVIPDGQLTGWTDTRSLAGAAGQITDVSVTLNLSGGWNGDLYAYLVHGSGFAVLLNRVGRDTGNAAGYGTAGMNVTLSDAAMLEHSLRARACDPWSLPAGRSEHQPAGVSGDVQQCIP